MAYTCPSCGAVSHHPMDEQEGYCGRCHTFADDIPLEREAARVLAKRPERGGSREDRT